MRILFTGGGSGGHLTPIVAVAEKLKAANEFASGQNPLEMMFIGPQTVGEEFLEKEGVARRTIAAGKLRRYYSGHNILDFFRVFIGFFQSLWFLFFYMPNVIFSKGGFGSVPIVIAAWIYRIPILTHESDAQPGLANRIISKFSKRVAIAFPRAAEFFPAKKTALIGIPIRPEILTGTKEQASTIFHLTGGKPIILVVGGSQGAKSVNDIIVLALPDILKKYEVIHQCGHDNFEELKQLLGQNLPANYHLYPFLDQQQMAAALAAADLVISRAGGTSIFEIAACGKPSILIPITNSANDHQNLNAFDYAKTGATLTLVQENLTPHFLTDRVSALLDNPELLAKMSTAAKSFAKPEAASQIAKEILNIAKR